MKAFQVKLFLLNSFISLTFSYVLEVSSNRNSFVRHYILCLEKFYRLESKLKLCRSKNRIKLLNQRPAAYFNGQGFNNVLNYFRDTKEERSIERVGIRIRNR